MFSSEMNFLANFEGILFKVFISLLKYWLKLTRTQNCILKNSYELTLRSFNQQNIKIWLAEIRDIFISIGMVDVWQQQRVENERLFLYLA